MKSFSIHREQVTGELVGRILCHDVRGERREIVFRKGHALRHDDVPLLLTCPWSELHLLELNADEIGQKEAGERLASAISGESIRSVPSGHKQALKSTQKGLLEVDVTALRRLNSLPGIAIYTLFNDQVVWDDEVVAYAQITPLALSRGTIERAEEIAYESGGLVRVRPFVPRSVVVLMRERHKSAERDRVLDSLSRKLHWFGCSIQEVADLPEEPPAIRKEIEGRFGTGATLFVISGSNALDPLDPILVALEQIGARMRRVGMPVHPGTLLWLASWGEISLIGLPSCGLASQATVFDLLVPKLLAHGEISDQQIAALGHGGILNRSMAFRFAPYERSERLLEQETADEPVR